MNSARKEAISGGLRKLLTSNWLLAALAFLCVTKLAALALVASVPQSDFFADITKGSLEQSVNQTRAALNLQPLTEDPTLQTVAQLKAEDMIKNDYFAHTSPAGLAPWYWFAKAGYNYQYAGENLAIGFFDSDQVYQAWLNSPTHRANIINPRYQQMGTAVMSGFGSDNTTIVVQVFGTEKASLKPAPATQKLQPVAQKPAPTVVQQPKVASTEPGKVLSEQSQAPAAKANAPVWAQKIMSNGYNKVFGQIAFSLSLILIGILFTIVVLSGKPVERPLAVRTAGLVALLVCSWFINDYLLQSVIPSHLFI